MNRAGFISLMSVALLGSALGSAAMATDAQDHDAVEARALRELNNEIAFAVANFTGLTQ